jgi:hypothetical protein
METQQPPTIPPSPLTPPQQIPKKGLGTGAKIGIGCGALLILAIIGGIIGGIMLGGKLKTFAENAQKNPTRTMADIMVTASAGTMEMVAEDDANKRYTVKEKKSGTLTTIYWDEVKRAPEVIPGDFSAIPLNSATVEPEPQPESGSSVPDPEK